jgi:DNA invertase Pin-like site-specific DNA recombinase/DNA-binding CsgD family transcriptional regulator
MLERKYEPTLPYHFVRYGRMSDPKNQNKRSPDQQFSTIDETIARCKYPWIHAQTYRDDGISGRFLRKRPGFQRMLRDIEAGLIEIDLIVVDTLERLGRAEEIAELRRKLFVEHGVLIVAADNNFCDPTGVVGKAVGMVEQIRSTENTRISRHNVIRGKKDTARRKRWPGGSPPFGHKMKAMVDNSVTPPEVYHVLEIEPREAAVMKLTFEQAARSGYGAPRMTKWWNANPEIPDDFKPTNPFTMANRLGNIIYTGKLPWGANRTGIVNDTRVIEPNPDGAEIIADFCEAIVSVELFERVQQLRQVRGAQVKRSREKKDATAKFIAPQAPGLALKYPLTGLVRCPECKASMKPMPSGRRSKSGKRYVYYCCPRHYDGACPNGRYFREDELRDAVFSRLRARLFPPPGESGQVPMWLPELTTLVQQELDRYKREEPDRTAAYKGELEDLEKCLAGWTLTLGDPHLSPLVRNDIVIRYEQARLRVEQLKQAIATAEALQGHVARMLQPQAVIDALHNLGIIMAEHNPTLVNLELGKHIDRIDCFPDGRVELRGTYIGLFEGAVELLSRDEGTTPNTAPGNSRIKPVKPRRRGRLRIPNLSAESQAAMGDVDTSLDPQRFAGLPETFFWTEVFVFTKKVYWPEAHAAEVARLRVKGETMAKLAEHFGVSVPTIRKALRHAADCDQSVKSLPKKMPRPRWHEVHAAEVAKLKAEGLTTKELADRFGKSDTTIRAALRYVESCPPAESPRVEMEPRDRA